MKKLNAGWPRFLLWFYVFYQLFTLKDGIVGSEWITEYLLRFQTFKGNVLWLSSMLSFLLYSALAYILLLRYWPDRKGLVYLMLPLAIPVGIFFRYAIQELLFPASLGFSNYNQGVDLKYYFLDNLYYALIFIPFGIIYFFVRYSRHEELQRQQAELDLKRSELAFLRAQINPHFLFNTLNNLYSLVSSSNPASLEVITDLSSLLRYALYEKRELVPLHTDLDALKVYMKLENIRRTSPVQLEIRGDVPSASLVPPLVLLPIVENLFKHGANGQGEVSLEFVDDRLTLRTRNEVVAPASSFSGGIGLANVAKRLALAYGGNYQLTTRTESGRFYLQLEIPLRT